MLSYTRTSIFNGLNNDGISRRRRSLISPSKVNDVFFKWYKSGTDGLEFTFQAGSVAYVEEISPYSLSNYYLIWTHAGGSEQKITH